MDNNFILNYAGRLSDYNSILSEKNMNKFLEEVNSFISGMENVELIPGMKLGETSTLKEYKLLAHSIAHSFFDNLNPVMEDTVVVDLENTSADAKTMNKANEIISKVSYLQSEMQNLLSLSELKEDILSNPGLTEIYEELINNSEALSETYVDELFAEAEALDSIEALDNFIKAAKKDEALNELRKENSEYADIDSLIDEADNVSDSLSSSYDMTEKAVGMARDNATIAKASAIKAIKDATKHSIQSISYSMASTFLLEYHKATNLATNIMNNAKITFNTIKNSAIAVKNKTALGIDSYFKLFNKTRHELSNTIAAELEKIGKNTFYEDNEVFYNEYADKGVSEYLIDFKEKAKEKFSDIKATTSEKAMALSGKIVDSVVSAKSMSYELANKASVGVSNMRSNFIVSMSKKIKLLDEADQALHSTREATKTVIAALNDKLCSPYVPIEYSPSQELLDAHNNISELISKKTAVTKEIVEVEKMAAKDQLHNDIANIKGFFKHTFNQASVYRDIQFENAKLHALEALQAPKIAAINVCKGSLEKLSEKLQDRSSEANRTLLQSEDKDDKQAEYVD